mmetsp:Transcript_11806/g.15423  ORF Transcript_11806/g.15423 Transcript_11806/m.15423 type:complete len:229 (+) Transcript_11806:169-855(+)|eukprot:CAMPEP_0117741346 /NCGR_PEP_ID=MMETSP0947-20121206/4859_1 /TAXON_ID=44440 /ORGANISM="Chattonella subsalsa, Strain CCMP2191" /LENGTH=228 /DNA_ID=CAMNT_0005557587 /DNA_START=162 /DNA_END=848 /DNA_ORIENTATION=-
MIDGDEKAGTDSRFVTPRSAAGQPSSGNISSDDSFVSPRGYSSAGAGYHSQGYHSAVSHYSTDENFLSPRENEYLNAEVKSGTGEFHSAREYKESKYSTIAPDVHYEDDTHPEDFDSKDVEDIFSYARHNRVEDLERLLDAGMPINIRDQYGNTVLAVACQNGHKRSAKLALRRGADINARNYRGNTPLHFCFTYGYGDSLGQYLISKGADPTIRNNDGITCYEGIKK